MRILLVEDDDRIATPLCEDLRHQNYIIDWAEDGLSGLHHSQAADYDLILLDLMLPQLDGISLCRQLRSEGYSGFILMLTAKDATTDKVLGLDAGADDYLIKPFELEELAARIRALARRPVQMQQSQLRAGKLSLCPQTHAVNYEHRQLSLTPKEFLLLEHLMEHPGQVFTRTMLLDKLWELDRESSEATIRTHLTNLRRKIRQAGCPTTVIETVYGVGYRLKTS